MKATVKSLMARRNQERGQARLPDCFSVESLHTEIIVNSIPLEVRMVGLPRPPINYPMQMFHIWSFPRARHEDHEIARANRNAAPAATLPINAVWSALRIGRVPVKRPLMNPKTNNVTRVNAIEKNNARVVSRVNM